MFKHITGTDDGGLISAVQGLPEFYFEGGWAEKLKLELWRLPETEGDDLQLIKRGERCRIGFREKIHIFRALGLLREHAGRPDFTEREKMRIPRIGVMVDASRNSVPRIGFLKEILKRMALMGLNCLILYMEDVYELDGEPFFGYMRGGYSKAQLKELDAYADRYGIRIVASIQVLGHMEKVLRFPQYASVRDTPSCLLAGEEKTYALIEKMLQTIGECFQSRLVIVGMDETNGLGAGLYRLRNGIREPLEIFLEHLRRVHGIARRNGLEIALYSDMIFKYASKSGAYLSEQEELDGTVCEQIPGDARLIYWDYYSADPSLVDAMMKKHQKFGNAIYAGPLLSVSSFCVQYPATFRTARIALEAVKKYGISMAYGCMWHDDGAECGDWLGLLGMQYYAEEAYRETGAGRELLHARFAACTGHRAEWFEAAALLDAVDCANRDNRWPPNVSKYALWQDPLEGIYDADLAGLSLDAHYKRTAALLEGCRREAKERGWFLAVPCQLARVLEIKTALGAELHVHYKAGEKEALAEDVKRLETLGKEVEQLRALHREQWMKTCSPFGWSRLDLRYGGLLARLETAKYRLNRYLEGEEPEISELAAPRFPKDRSGALLGRGIWKVYAESATMSDG